MELSFSLFQSISVGGGVWLPILFLLLVVCRLWGKKDPNRHRYPPGPGYALPLIGNLYQLGTKPHLTFLKWKKHYAPLVFFKMGSENQGAVFHGGLIRKTTGPFWTIFSYAGHGIINSDGETATSQRAFAVKTLTELGLSKSGRLEGFILEEVGHLVKYFEAKVGGTPFRATRLFNGAAVSSLWSIVSGEKVEWIDKDGVLTESEICKHSGQVVVGLNKAMTFGLTVLPGLRHLPIFSSVWKAYESAVANFHGMVETKIQEHAESLDTPCPRDFIDHGLIKVGSSRDPNSSFYKETGRLNLRTAAKDLFFGGSETTPTVLEYLFMYLGAHPKIQEKLQKELDGVIGGRRPTLSDRKMLPYAQAVVMETLRRSVAAASAAHRMLHDLEFQGYLLPKDALVLLDVYGIHRDGGTWGDADSFRPERFLSEDDGSVVVVVAHESYMPFGAGRRNCIGASLALDTLFLCLTSIFQRFRVEVVHDNDGGTFDLDNVQSGCTLEHEPFDIRVYRRNIM